MLLGEGDPDELLEPELIAYVTDELGGVVVSTADDQWVRTAVVRDPQGAELVVSQFAPQDW